MISILIYLAKASGLISLFFTAYYLLLKKETFFTTIRFFLMAGILIAFIVPLVTITKTVWVDPQPLPDFSPISSIPYNFSVVQTIENTGFEINWQHIAISIYSIGIIFLLGRFIFDILKIKSLLKTKQWVREGQYKLINSTTVSSPFSFFRYIIYNSSLLQPEEVTTIIAHEKVHGRQLHSLDMLLSQLTCIFIWFNPFVWLYKQQIAQNLEFIADAEAVKSLSNRKEYQKTLLKITLQPECIAITNHFYQSLIKKRIVMLNKKQSEKYNFWKFTVVLPALVAFFYFFQTEVIAKEKIVDLHYSAPQQPERSATLNTASKDTVKTKKITQAKTSVNTAKALQEKNKIIVVNGAIQTNNVIYPSGKEMVVTELSAEEAIKKYGDRGKYGAIEYTTTVEFDPGSSDKTTNIIHTTTTTESSNNITTSITDRVKEMNASPYRTVSVVTYRDNEGNPVANDNKDIYFVISNMSTDVQLERYKEDLAVAGITVEYSDLIRNSKGKITGIKVKLNDKKNKASATWSSDRNKDGIPDIYIGKIKGKLTASSNKTT